MSTRTPSCTRCAARKAACQYHHPGQKASSVQSVKKGILMLTGDSQLPAVVLTVGKVIPSDKSCHNAAKVLLFPAHRRMEPTLALMLTSSPPEVGASQRPSKPSRSVWSCTSFCTGCLLLVQTAHEAITQHMLWLPFLSPAWVCHLPVPSRHFCLPSAGSAWIQPNGDGGRWRHRCRGETAWRC